jgi:enolase
MKITKLIARQVLDSRGNPTIEVEAYFNAIKAVAIVPSGASTGKYEALELRDGKKDYLGKSVMKAVDNVNNVISKKIVGMEFLDQKSIDEAMIALDGTKNKTKLGANAILGVSMAVCRLAALIKQKQLYEYIAELAHEDSKALISTLPLANLLYDKISNKSSKLYSIPVPFANVINGGKHAGSSLKIQEFMITPVYAKNFKDAIRMTAEVYHTLKKLVEEKYGKAATNVGDEGGFAPQLTTPEQALDLLVEAIKKAGYKGKMMISIDAAASEFYDEATGNYVMDKPYTKDEMVDYYIRLIKTYPIATLEDPFDQDDFDSWAKLTAKASKLKVPIIGDDLLVSNTERIKMAIDKKLCSALLLKVNQIGTLTEAINAAKMAHGAGWIVMVSHRSGETEDTFIADLAVGLGCGHIKLGAPCRSERVAKYNQLLRISEQDIKYAKW